MASMIIGGNNFTDELEVCNYNFKRFPATEINGEGEVVSGGYPEISIRYSYLSASGFDFWANTICAGLASKTHTSATLYDDSSSTTTFTNLVVFYPTYDGVEGQFYTNVGVRITQLVES
ncbi:MAG: hypothetical protein KDE46_14240 [Caldilineaceae bacterium]|nr:hypothetical protein [Caldilineaceae bacterium]